MGETVNIEAVNISQRLALTSEGDTLKLSGWLNDDGEDCEPEDAVACWGQRAEGEFYTIDLEEYEAVSVQ